MAENNTNSSSEPGMATQNITANLDAGPASKLDAEHFVAEDTDGIVESVVGSGNATYAFLQGQQAGGEPVQDGGGITGLDGPDSDSASAFSRTGNPASDQGTLPPKAPRPR